MGSIALFWIYCTHSSNCTKSFEGVSTEGRMMSLIASSGIAPATTSGYAQRMRDGLRRNGLDGCWMSLEPFDLPLGRQMCLQCGTGMIGKGLSCVFFCCESCWSNAVRGSSSLGLTCHLYQTI